MVLQQVLEGRYIDRARLIQLLKKTFGENNFGVRVCTQPVLSRVLSEQRPDEPQMQLNSWILTVPKKLTEVRFL
jgi:hypothetical protein